MNPGGAPGVAVDASAGVKVSWLLGVAIGATVLGVLLLGGGVDDGRPGRAGPAGAAARAGRPGDRAGRGGRGDTGSGRRPPGTGRRCATRWTSPGAWRSARAAGSGWSSGSCLIPHYIVLFFLWIAYFVVTVIAFFAILFTARYPRELFEFNVGVLRWTWRVGFYGYSAPWAPTATRRSASTAATTRPRSTCPTPSGSRAAWCW